MIEGDAFRVVPVPMINPPQVPENQFHFAFVPRLPPFKFIVIEPPGQMTPGVKLTESGITDNVSTNTEILIHAVVLQVPSALTKYVVVTVGDTEIVVSLPIMLLPQAEEYQCQLPPFPKAPPEHVRLTI